MRRKTTERVQRRRNGRTRDKTIRMVAKDVTVMPQLGAQSVRVVDLKLRQHVTMLNSQPVPLLLPKSSASATGVTLTRLNKSIVSAS